MRRQLKSVMRLYLPSDILVEMISISVPGLSNKFEVVRLIIEPLLQLDQQR